MAINVTTTEISLSLAPVASHKRAAVTGTAGTLGSFISGGIPVNASGKYGVPDQYPKAVYLQVESGTSASVYACLDGVSTATATLGLLLPQGPSTFKVVGDDLFRNDRISLISSSGTAYVQCFFVF